MQCSAKSLEAKIKYNGRTVLDYVATNSWASANYTRNGKIKRKNCEISKVRELLT